MPSGQLRFYGIDAMRVVRELVDGDPEYTWSYAPWPYEWIDVFPKSVEAQNELVDLVGPSGR
jgi:hypothetical protein